MDHSAEESHRRSVSVRQSPAIGVFLEERLTEELSLLWARDASCTRPQQRPGLAAQVAVIDDLLATVRGGALPSRRDLHTLLVGYSGHPDFDSDWFALLSD